VTDWHIIAVKIESLTSAIPFIDGGEEAAFDPSNDDIDGVGFGLFGLSIGACYDGSEPGDAQFAEIILASGDVNAQSRATVFSYLSTKWNVAVTPAIVTPDLILSSVLHYYPVVYIPPPTV
jgi:hypothetical protein